MERNFCGKCGRPVSECICGVAPVIPAAQEFAAKAGERVENIALAMGETVVRSYKFGTYSKFFGLGGKGKATLMITNRRVICKSEMKRNTASANIVEELALNEVTGVKTYFAGGLNMKRLLIGIVAAIVTIIGVIYAIDDVNALTLSAAGLPVALWMFFTMRRTRYLFTLYTRATTPNLTMKAKVRGKMGKAVNNIAFEYEPTKEVQGMMSEMGACIMDLKTRGSAAVSAWKNV